MIFSTFTLAIFSSKLGKLLNSTHLNCRRPKWTTPQRDECRTVHALMMMVCSSVNSMNANTRRRDGGMFGGRGAGDVPFFNALCICSWTGLWWHDTSDYGNTGCRVFKQGIKNWKDFCLKINIPKGNYWNLRIGVVARCQKVPKFDFQSNFLCQISSESFSIFLLKNLNLEGYFLLLTFLITSIFKSLYFLK